MNRNARAVTGEFFLQHFHHIFIVRRIQHINKIENDDPAQIALPHLMHVCFGRFQISFQNGIGKVAP